MRETRNRIGARRRRALRLSVAAVLTGALLGPGAPLAQELVEAEQRLLSNLEARAELSALTDPLEELQTGVLQQGGFERLELGQGERGVDQPAVILATCDIDCRDIDLYLVDAEGQEVARATEVGPAPDADNDRGEGDFTSVEAVLPLGYAVFVYMADCQLEPCGFAAGIFPAPTE